MCGAGTMVIYILFVVRTGLEPVIGDHRKWFGSTVIGFFCPTEPESTNSAT